MRLDEGSTVEFNSYGEGTCVFASIDWWSSGCSMQDMC